MPGHDTAKTHPKHHFDCMWHDGKANKDPF